MSRFHGFFGLFFAFAVLTVTFYYTSCASTPVEEDEDKNDSLYEAQAKMKRIETEEQDFDLASAGQSSKSGAAGVRLTGAIPAIAFYGRGVKIEFENMFLNQFSLFDDKEASGGCAAKLDSVSSRAEFSITLPAGRYECLVSEKAFDGDRSSFSVSIGGISYELYPSNPPLGSWELTTRVPVYIDVDEEKAYPVVITSATPGMSLDYIQFVKIK